VRKLLLIILLLSFGQTHSIAYMNEEIVTYTYLGIEYECIFFSKHSEPPILYDAKDRLICGDESNVFGFKKWNPVFYIEDNEVVYL